MAGWYRGYSHLTQVLVLNAGTFFLSSRSHWADALGHMSPYDEPVNVNWMVFQWIAGKFGPTLGQ